MFIAFIGLIIGAIAGALCTYFTLQRKVIELKQDLKILEKNGEAFEKERQKIKQDSEEKYSAIIAEKEKSIYEIKYQYENRLRQQKQEYDASLKNQKDDYAKVILELKQSTREAFSSIASEILKRESTDLQTQGTKTIQHILAPFKTEIDNFKGLINQWNSNNTKNTASLEEQIKSINQTTQGMMQSTENLTKALKGDKKIQGNWGEMIIKDILDTAGLVEGKHYIPQAKEMKLEDSDTGKRQMPDFVINLPNSKHIVLDSKVSLINYEQYCSSQDESFLKEFIKNVQNQIDNLSSKKYHTNEKLNTPDFTIMCIPIEPAYLLAIKEDPALYSKALQKHIVLCGPSNLFAILQIVGNLWITDNQNKNAKEIARRAKDIFDKLGHFTKSIESIGKSINQASVTYQTAYGQLIDGNGSIAKKLSDINNLATKHGLLVEGEILENASTEKPIQEFLT